MEELVSEGLVRDIGCSNIGVGTLRDVFCYAKVRPSVLQVELHPYLTQAHLVRFCRENSVAITAYSSFGGGSYVELGTAKEAEACWTEPLIKGIAEKHGKTAPQVLLRWALQRGTAVIPKSMKAERIAENKDLFDFVLSAEEMASIDALDVNRRFNDPGTTWPEFLPIFA